MKVMLLACMPCVLFVHIEMGIAQSSGKMCFFTRS